MQKIKVFFPMAAGFGAIAISLLHLFGVLDMRSVTERIGTITLLLLGIVVEYIALEMRSKLDETHDLLSKVQQQLLSQPLQGIEFFTTTDEILDRMREVTIGAESVSTLNLSPAKGDSLALDSYFVHVHQYAKQQDSQLKSFRTLATLESISKARWILQRSADLAPTGRVSTNVFMQDSSIKIPVGFHIVYRKHQSPYVFFYPPVNPAGIMDGFLIKNEQVAEIMLKYFEFMWNASICVHAGKRIDKKGLEEIVKIDASLSRDKNYIELLKQAALHDYPAQRERSPKLSLDPLRKILGTSSFNETSGTDLDRKPPKD